MEQHNFPVQTLKGLYDRHAKATYMKIYKNRNSESRDLSDIISQRIIQKKINMT